MGTTSGHGAAEPRVDPSRSRPYYQPLCFRPRHFGPRIRRTSGRSIGSTPPLPFATVWIAMHRINDPTSALPNVIRTGGLCFAATVAGRPLKRSFRPTTGRRQSRRSTKPRPPFSRGLRPSDCNLLTQDTSSASRRLPPRERRTRTASSRIRSASVSLQHVQNGRWQAGYRLGFGSQLQMEHEFHRLRGNRVAPPQECVHPAHS